MVGKLFIKDPSWRKSWLEHINGPITIEPITNLRLSGPPRTFQEAKDLADQLLRMEKVVTQIDELGSTTGAVLSAEHVDALTAAGVRHASMPASEAVAIAQALISANTGADPRKNLASGKPGLTPTGTASDCKCTPPKDPKDGKFLCWSPALSLCECGTPDEGRHIRYKWPCAWYRKPADDTGGSPTNLPVTRGHLFTTQSSGRLGLAVQHSLV